MREILFKAKRIDNGEWVEGYLFRKYYQELPHDRLVIQYKTMSNEYEWTPRYMVAEIDENTICQYTGLTDKNGNKIWENDIVKKHFYTDYDACANSEEYTGVVKFMDCAWVIEFKRDIHICAIPIIESITYSHDIEYFEVIGNIFDNPELIGGGE